ncbi:MAG: HlyD family efflux transporter periplasmic adaptor subunit [Proteobacteria bacterium]|nr:HlyD family efflux transporter periplasmic adaptor subunit [Pseudomonadota bacterium]
MQAAVRRRIALWGALGILLLAGLVGAFWPQPLAVDLLTVSPGPMVVTVGDEGETRVTDVFVVSAPIAGRARRIEVDPGDLAVANETLLAEIEPSDPLLLDPRSEAQARAQLSAAESAETAARAEVEKAGAELEFSRSELERARELASNGALSDRDLEAAEQLHKSSLAAFSMARATLQVRTYELERARAELMSPADAESRRKDCECISILSPIDGRVLRVLRESEGVVAAGDPLIEIGDPGRLEVVVDLLSTDAVRVRPGQSALLENWGGDGALRARVRRVEPFGFTKVSALGIEEQRVNVVLDIVSPRADWRRLAHGYQVDVRIVLWENDGVIGVPLTALFRSGDGWALFVSESDRAVLRAVQVGHRTDRDAEIVEGLMEGEEIVVYPGEEVEEGARLARRS